MIIRREYDLPGIDEERFSQIISTLEAKYNRLQEKGIVVSQLAKETMLLAIIAIVTEPNRMWSDFSEDERRTMQENFVEAVGFNLLSLSYELRKTPERGDPNIKIFDAIDAIANYKWCRWCMITASTDK